MIVIRKADARSVVISRLIKNNVNKKNSRRIADSNLIFVKLSSAYEVLIRRNVSKENSSEMSLKYEF